MLTSFQTLQHPSFRFQILCFMVNTEITMHYKSKKKIKNKINYISHERWNVRSDQRSSGFRVGHCQVQLTGVDIYAAIIMLIPFFVHLISFISDFLNLQLASFRFNAFCWKSG